jgi:hypothetical protein
MTETACAKHRLSQDTDSSGHSFQCVATTRPSGVNCCGYYSFAEVHFSQASIVLGHVLLIRALLYPFCDVQLYDTSVDTHVNCQSATQRGVIAG